MEKYTSPDQKKDALISKKDTSVNTQRKQIIALINKYQSRNTPEFREHGIMQPASRILELKEQSYKIEKVLERFIDSTGKVHKGVARYYLANNPPSNIDDSEVAA
jgi:hypothetical protein